MTVMGNNMAVEINQIHQKGMMKTDMRFSKLVMS